MLYTYASVSADIKGLSQNKMFTLKPSRVTSGVFGRPSFEKFSKNHPCYTTTKVNITKSEASIYPPFGESISDR